ncbi:MAG: magnesium/cobalt transporter CorA [Phycisphaera sp.]|nr:magnesium/cobalt transporter CorA [Phycisphaera sp.]
MPDPSPQPPPAPKPAITGLIGKVIQTGLERVPLRKHRPGASPGIEPHQLAQMAADAAHAAKAHGQNVRLSCIDYSPDNVLHRDITHADEFIEHHRPEWSTVRWINLDGLSDLKLIQALTNKYEIHPLAVEDILHVPQRPKLDAYPQADGRRARLVVITRMIQLQDDKLHREQITLVLGHNTVITFQETPGDVWDPIRQRIHTAGSRLRTNDASFLVYALLDAIVDHCFPILEHYSDRLEELEDLVLADPSEKIMHKVHEIRRELLLLRRDVWPMREVVNALQQETHECMSDATRVYLKDVYSHAVQIIDILETFREMATALTETYMSAVGNRMNQIMKVLTLMGTIFIPLTFLAGVYGMNFHHMPELDWWVSYPLFWVFCAVTASGMVWWFRKRGWL